MKFRLALACIPLVALSACQDPATSTQGSGRNEIRIVGSSTVFPFAKAVAEQFVNEDPRRPSPILESTGSGGGIELFCAGAGPNTPDIVNASRRMKASEFERCKQNGVDGIIELTVGIDGVALTQSLDAVPLSLDTSEVYKALAANPFGAKSNTAKTWKDVDASLPSVKISVYGPPSTSGTRESLTDLIMEPGCTSDAGMAKLKTENKEKFEDICHGIRTDNGYVATGENDNLIIQKLGSNPEAVGVLGYSYLEENASTVRGIAINGVEPNTDTISSGKYPGARPLYIYIKKSHLGVIPGLKEYIGEFLSAGGRDGYLVKSGMIAAHDDVRTAMKKRFDDQVALDVAELQ